MKITVVGVGAMGSIYAGLLADAGHEVWVIDIWKKIRLNIEDRAQVWSAIKKGSIHRLLAYEHLDQR